MYHCRMMVESHEDNFCQADHSGAKSINPVDVLLDDCPYPWLHILHNFLGEENLGHNLW